MRSPRRIGSSSIWLLSLRPCTRARPPCRPGLTVMNSVVVLVLAWNGCDFLPTCLKSLLAQAYPGRHAVLVVDNASVDGSADLVRRDFPEVALLTNERNLGFAGGHNAGLRALLAGHAPAPIDFIPGVVVLLNQYTEVAPGWLR